MMIYIYMLLKQLTQIIKNRNNYYEKEREDKKNPVVLTSVTFICCILFLSVGFSKFSSRLNINGIGATVRLKKDVRISGISLKETKSNAISMSEDYNVNSILTEIKLPNNDSEITYNIDVLNLGNAFVALRDISGLPVIYLMK